MTEKMPCWKNSTNLNKHDSQTSPTKIRILKCRQYTTTCQAVDVGTSYKTFSKQLGPVLPSCGWMRTGGQLTSTARGSFFTAAGTGRGQCWPCITSKWHHITRTTSQLLHGPTWLVSQTSN